MIPDIAYARDKSRAAHGAEYSLRTSPYRQDLEDRMKAGKTLSEALTAALEGMRPNSAVARDILAAAADLQDGGASVLTAAAQVAHHDLEAARERARARYGEGYGARVAQYTEILREAMRVASCRLPDALDGALSSVESTDLRDLLMAAALELIALGVVTPERAAESTPTSTAKPRQTWAWVGDIGKSALLLDVESWGSVHGELAERLTDMRFKPLPYAVELREGWCYPQDPMRDLSDGIDLQEVQHGMIITLGWRVDEVKPPKHRIGHLVREAEAEWCQREGKARCPRSVSKDLKEGITLAIVRASTPETKVILVVLDCENSRILVHTTREKIVTSIRSALRHAGIAFEVHVSEDALTPGAQAQMAGAYPDDLRDEGLPKWDVDVTVESPVIRGDVRREFLTWLWYRASSAGGTAIAHGPDSAIEWWIETPIQLVSPDGEGDKPGTITIAGSECENRAAGLAALAEGYRPMSLRIGLRLPQQPPAQDGEGNDTGPAETMEFHATLEDYEAKAVGLPVVVAAKSEEDVEAAVFERVELWDRFAAARDLLWRRFCDERSTPDTWAPTRTAIRTWVGLELAQRFTFAADGQGLLFGRRLLGNEP